MMSHLQAGNLMGKMTFDGGTSSAQRWRHLLKTWNADE
jgi:hypothetical protein